ncbi:hypothetical protein DESHY_40240 [Desulforamulus hydrothermalis Lam5 = DSM 18033]|uniref:Uncharacterized protein n=1 Tax=Desulforamulus hydrothermalis Lam5 = DSM 18033 TaxID=1121428 RepID=K8E001_9FIRM|nr:hypothetical protein DESHY_40240 [Desulforamulus hydrothermalis Lam5 = DSM 18033]
MYRNNHPSREALQLVAAFCSALTVVRLFANFQKKEKILDLEIRRIVYERKRCNAYGQWIETVGGRTGTIKNGKKAPGCGENQTGHRIR